MRFRKFSAVVLTVLLLLSFTSCGSSKSMVYDNASGSAAGESGLVDKEANYETSLPENQKLIQKVWLNVETEDLDTLMGQVNSQISALGGYVEAQEVYNGSAYSGRRYRHADLTVRIPAESLEGFVQQVSDVSNIVSTNKTTENITLSYVATESRMNALQTEQTRLLELLAQAQNMDEILQIEARLTQVRAELEAVTSTLRLYDNQVTYATVYLNISEVTEYTVTQEPETVWEEIGAGFSQTMSDIGEGLKDFFVFVVVNSPYLLVLAAAAVGLILLYKRRKRKNAPPQDHKPE